MIESNRCGRPPPLPLFFIRMRTYGGDRSLADPRGIGQNVGEFAINFLRRRKMMVYRLILNEKGFEITYNGRKL